MFSFKKIFPYIFVFLLGSFCVYFFWVRSGSNELKLKVITFDEKNEYSTIHLEYPNFSDLPKSLNEKIKNELLVQVGDFKKSAEENTKARKENAPANAQLSAQDLIFIAGWSAEQLNTNKISIIIRTYYYSGGAHGGHGIYTFSYDLKNKKEITLDTLFGKTNDYLLRLSQYTMNDLKNQLTASEGVKPNLSMLEEGTAPDPKNFSKFTLGPSDTITFYFEEYQVAPYASGEQKVIMPLSYILLPDKM